ncbi:MAG: pyridoxamine 5'-phosphate oxidase family protein [Promethearchaeota archaeon]|jgi:nitroimidazol reductase NimA-like FMN-containing flavoprotein (pyridoxamine 5'-phosphate oxidase superfamily)
MVDIKLPKMDDNEVEKVITNQKICRIAFIDESFPYIAPFQYIYFNESLYFHFTDYGKKIKILSKNKNVCVSIENLAHDLDEFYFISMQGELELLKNQEEIREVIIKIVKNAKENFSTNFLSAHGFDASKGWDNFKTDNQLIYKLIEKKKRIALKSKT